jgi:mono/diheme cytochrome c family protein
MPTRPAMRNAIAALLCTFAVAACTHTPAGGDAPRTGSDSTAVSASAVQTAATVPERVLSYEETQGGKLYEQYCMVCHGNEGKGDGFNAYNLDPRPQDFTDSTYMKALSDDQIDQTITGGGRSVNKSPLMPAYGWTLNGQQIRYLVSFVRSFRETSLP